MAKGISLAPCGLIIERIEPEADALIIVARPTSDFAACPTCGQHSTSVHSRYQRLLSDLPSQGRLVRIKILARRFARGAKVWARLIFRLRRLGVVDSLHGCATASLSVRTEPCGA